MILSWYTAINETAKTSGSLLGGELLARGGAAGYWTVFVATSIARALAALILLRLSSKESTEVEAYSRAHGDRKTNPAEAGDS